VVPGEAGVTQTLKPAQTPDSGRVSKKKSALPNSVNDGVRFGSLFTMWSVFSSTTSASFTAMGVSAVVLAYGSGAAAFPTSCSSFRSAGHVRSGWPLT